jgi:hypothetical protein
MGLRLLKLIYLKLQKLSSIKDKVKIINNEKEINGINNNIQNF